MPSWEPFSAKSQAGSTDSDSGALDLFRVCDAPVFEARHLNRTQNDERNGTSYGVAGADFAPVCPS